MIKRNVIRSDFSRNVLTLISGTTIAQFISIAISPILSRIYSPSDFGMFAAFSSVIALISLLIGGRYEVAILLPEKDEDAANLFALSLFINIIISLFSLCCVFLLSFLIPDSTRESELFKWFYITPFFTFFIGLAQSVNSWYNRRKQYRKIVHYRIANSAANNLSSFAMGYAKLSVNGLILSFLVASIISVSIFFNQMKSDYKQFISVVSKKQMIVLAKKYKHFPLINSLQSLSDAFQINGIIYFMSYFFDIIFVGIYSLAMRVLLVPMNFAGSAMAQVFYQHASETYNNRGDLRSLIKNTILKSLIIVIPVLIVLLLFGPQLFAFVFGEKWYDAGVYARILAPWILLDFMRAPLSQIPIIVGKQNKLLYLSLLSNVIIFSSMLYAGGVAHDIKTGLYFLSVFQSLYIVGIIIWIYKISSYPQNQK